MTRHLTLFCDGAARGNPGPGSFGIAIFEGPELVFQDGQTLGVVTNNTAEYEALIRGLEKCAELGAEEVTVKSDSELMVRQINGQYKVKSPHLKQQFERARILLRRFPKTNVLHIPRAQNKIADAMANRALDMQSGRK